ncbi:hypothetical protein ACFQFH_01265 [Halobaculum halobium]|uniref:Uncharacterized protein n=1 Tax=Halobaculum halobium TaxID=3032281 RepID=A0ABD5T5S4_9EURY|nr:hypothetical protein [Halobaculum sp. SYNS20]
MAPRASVDPMFALGLADDCTPSNPTRLAFARSVHDAQGFAESDAVDGTIAMQEHLQPEREFRPAGGVSLSV